MIHVYKTLYSYTYWINFYIQLAPMEKVFLTHP